MIAEASPKQPLQGAPEATSTGWAGGALLTAGAIAAVAKAAGVLVAPGLRGLASQATMDIVDTVTAALAYTLAALLVALLCAGSFELARAKRIGAAARVGVVALVGLVVALASPAVVMRLHVAAALGLAVVTSLVALVAGVIATRSSQIRAVGAVLSLLAVAGLLRPFAWWAATIGGEHASMPMFHFGVGLASVAVVLQALATLVSATWLATRSLWRGRVLANVAVVLAFALTYFAARGIEGPPSAFEAVLRASFGRTTGVELPGAFASVAAFLLPASMLLAVVALVQRAQPAAVIASLSLALISHGSYDVPLQALAVVVAAEWLMLATIDERGLWASLTRAPAQASPSRARTTARS